MVTKGESLFPRQAFLSAFSMARLGDSSSACDFVTLRNDLSDDGYENVFVPAVGVLS